jgi:hypothetical protein
MADCYGRSGKPDDLRKLYRMDVGGIVRAARRIVGAC